jgi:hypothetical protein
VQSKDLNLFLYAPNRKKDGQQNANLELMNRHLGYQAGDTLSFKVRLHNPLMVKFHIDRVELLIETEG